MRINKELVATAKKEWDFFGNDEGERDHSVELLGLDGRKYRVLKEVYGPYNDRIAEYWNAIPASSYKKLMQRYAPNGSRLDGSLRNLPWSAAFISWCMKTAGADAGFPYSSGHATWIVGAIRNRAAGNAQAALVGYKPNETPVSVGDLVGWSRGKQKVTYAQAVAAGWFESHTDIVVEVDVARGRAFSIGGNVGQSVARRELALDANGCFASRALLVHIVNRIGSAGVAVAALPQYERFA